jgi:hypothetical protein
MRKIQECPKQSSPAGLGAGRALLALLGPFTPLGESRNAPAAARGPHGKPEMRRLASRAPTRMEP